ncbi:GlcG/HbpS family heme-binding protein [Halomonas cupida]|uniref:GlcG/HbpS family heme-binding protein n=1 Tax=Halomonas cupida TaxID=44933 RepID=UPI003EF71AA3
MIHKARWSLLLGALCTSAALAQSTDIDMHPDVSLALANQVVEATLDACHADQHTAVVAVVDRGGNLVALQRDDNIGPHNTQAAQRKAFTALSTKTPTRQLAESARNHPESQNLATVSDLLLLGGGVPIRSNGEVIGAVGVAGAGGSATDEGCALEGINRTLPQDQ